MAKFEIKNWDLIEYRDALEKAYWLLHRDADAAPYESRLKHIEMLKHLSYLNGNISMRITKYRLQLQQHYRSAHDFLGERMATIELNDEKVDGVIQALDKGALSIGLIDRLDGRSVDLLRQLRTLIEEAKNA